MGFSTNWAQGGRGSSLVEQKGNSFVLFSSKIAASPTVGKGKRDFRLRLKLTAKQRKIGRNRPTCPTTNPSAKLAVDGGGEEGDEEDYRHDDHLRL